jgi:hypothetical protein
VATSKNDQAGETIHRPALQIARLCSIGARHLSSSDSSHPRRSSAPIERITASGCSEHNVHQGTAVQTGVQSRSELTFKDQTITRLGEKTIFSVGEGPRTIDLGSGQFLLYAPKKAGGAKVKAGAVTAAITG